MSATRAAEDDGMLWERIDGSVHIWVAGYSPQGADMCLGLRCLLACECISERCVACVCVCVSAWVCVGVTVHAILSYPISSQIGSNNIPRYDI